MNFQKGKPSGSPFHLLHILEVCAIIQIGGDEMDKEILTLEIIQKDVKKYFSRDLLIALIILPIFVLSSVMVVFLMTLLLNLVIQDKTTLKIIGSVVLFLLGLVYLDILLKTIRKRIKFAKSEIKITEDKLVGKIPQHGTKYNRTFNTLVFAKSGKYELGNDYFYRWSKLCSMSQESLYRSSNVDDEFYVASVAEENIIVYNKKMFELRQ